MDNFSSFIDQSLVDNTSAGADRVSNMNGASEYGNELFYQLLLSAVNSPNQADSLATINPNSLTATGTAMDSASGYADLASDVASDPNAFLTAALLSALDPLASTDINNTMLQGDSAMLIDSPESAGKAASSSVAASEAPAKSVAATASKAASAKSTAAIAVGAGAKRQTIQQQALSTTASKRNGNINSASNTGSVGTAQKTQGPTAHRSTTPGVSSASKASAAAAAAAAMSEDAHDDIDMEGIDLKSLSSKERRQLRNKISARNFRVRRKEYISTLEAEVRVIKEENESLRSELTDSKKDNVQLRDEINKLRHRINQLSVSQQHHSTPVSSGAVSASAGRAVTGSAAQQQQSLLTRPSGIAISSAANGMAPALSAQSAATATTAAASASAAVAKPLAAPQTMAAMPRFNPHKDIGQAAAKKGGASANGSPSAAGGNWASKSSQTGFIAVNTAVMPPSHGAAVDQLVLDMRRQQSVDALLDIQKQSSQEEEQLCMDPALVLAALEAGSLIAELLLSQVAIEASLALVHPLAAMPFVAGVCS
ncbi:hypothetical protein FB645_005808 [Coemansia sp. IMI 203386]|nr:hypothetical protein FB645_005808 [Coemansia sp. IMI 203386]